MHKNVKELLSACVTAKLFVEKLYDVVDGKIIYPSVIPPKYSDLVQVGNKLRHAIAQNDRRKG